MFRMGGLVQALLPGPQGTRVHTLWSGSPWKRSIRVKQVQPQIQCLLCAGGDCLWLTHCQDGPFHSAEERTKSHASYI
jgi:hypothetical protein